MGKGRGKKRSYEGGGGKSGREAFAVVGFADASTKHCASGYLVHACLAGERTNVNNIVTFARHWARPGIVHFSWALRPLPLELAGAIELLRAAARVLDIGQLCTIYTHIYIYIYYIHNCACIWSSPVGKPGASIDSSVNVVNFGS